MAYQFIHLETYGRKPDTKGRSVGYVLDEASRAPDATLHVDSPQPPELVFGMPLDELRAVHDQRAGNAFSVDVKGKPRKARIDQHTLCTIIASHPGGDPADVAKWESLTLAWLQATYGERLASVVRHVDEGHPHLHIYVLPGPDDASMKARAFHPGVVAKEQARSSASDAGADAKTANKTGDKAYKAAMRTWQDSYWHAVGIPCGLARIGPGRRRLSRAGWQAEQDQVKRVAGLADALAEADRVEAVLRESAPQLEMVAKLGTTAAAAGDAVERGRAVIHLLSDQVANLKQERDALIHAVEVAKTDADRVVVEAQSVASSIVARARSQAAGILIIARREAERLKSMGAVLGGFVQGILGASPSKVEHLVRAEEQELAKARESELLFVSKGLRSELREAFRERDVVMEALREVSGELDALRSTVNVWNPEQPLAQSRLLTGH